MPEFRIFLVLGLIGMLFVLYKMAIRLSKGTLIVKILKLVRHFYGLDDIK
jgi:hypothetical protein